MELMNHFSHVIDRSEKRHHAERLLRHFSPLLLCSSINQPSSWHSCKPRSISAPPPPSTDTRHLVPLPSLWPFSLSDHTWTALTAPPLTHCPLFPPRCCLLRLLCPVASPRLPSLVFRGEQTKLLIISVMQPLGSALIKGAASGLCMHRQPLG